jgi:type IV pilus assembly protein PilC
MSEVYRDVTEGSALSEAFAKHPKVFTNLYISLVGAGEETGDLTAIYKQLVKYMKWLDAMQSKIRKATRYPMIVSAVVVLVIVVMMGYVVPQIVGFIINMKQELPWYTKSLIAASNFFKNYWWAILATPIVIIILIKVSRRMSSEVAFRLDLWYLSLPLFGQMIRKINIARFAQTFGALYSSGIDVLYALEAGSRTINNLALKAALDSAYEQVQNGSPLSDAFNSSGEFPSLVVRMLKVGEESGDLTAVLDQVAEFYSNDVDEAVQGLITMIEPALTGLLGIIILWIAAGVFGPIYNSFGKLNM